MTAENPQTRYGRCDECGKQIKVKKNSMGNLVLNCGCGITRPIKVSRALPDTWL